MYSLADLELPFLQDELASYAERRKRGVTKRSMDWIDRASRDLWKHTNGIISKATLDDLTLCTLTKYHSVSSHAKTLGFATSFLKYLTKTRLDTRYHAFEIFLERPKTITERRHVTSRIITKADVESVLTHIADAKAAEILDEYREAYYRAFILFGAYTGQRPMATMARITVGQLKAAVRNKQPCLQVLPYQDKIKMEQYVPLHPQVVDAIKPLLVERDNGDLFFEYNSFSMWLKRHQVPLTRIKGYFNLSDLRKWCQQMGDIIEWDQSNSAYILSHGVSSVDWKHYRRPLPEHVYDVYMRYWTNVRFELP